MSNRCLACDSETLSKCLDLGNQPLANNFTDTPADQERYPLGVVLCNKCNHLQLTYFVNPDLIFKNYLYVSGTSETYLSYMKWFADYTNAKPYEYVLDIGCNDGSQLDVFKQKGCYTFGVDPATNLYEISSKKHKVFIGYFDENLELPVHFNVITAQNVFAHNRAPLEFLKKCKTLAHDNNSRIYIQTSQADMIINNEFDTIYHEHINFFNVISFKLLAERSGLVLLDVIKTFIHGTSYIFTLGISGEPSVNVMSEIRSEISNGLYSFNTYSKWADRIHSSKIVLKNLLSHKYIIAYGACAKGMTLLNFIDIVPDVIIDDNHLKQGKYSPGIKTKIVSPDFLTSVSLEKSITFLPLAWNLFSEIKNKIIKLRNTSIDEFIDLRCVLKI